MQEGVLPSLFNTASNLNYVGSYPKTEFYGTEFVC